MPRQEHLVFGALALTFHVSRLAGVGPLRMVRRGGGWSIGVSTFWTIYSYFILIILHTGIVVGFIKHFLLDTDYKRTMVTSSLLFIEFAILLLITTVGVVNGPKRMAKTIEYLKTIDKIQISRKLNEKDQISPKNYKMMSMAIILLVVAFLQSCGESGRFLFANYKNIDPSKRPLSIYTTICYYTEFFLAILIETQFIFLSWSIKSVLESINNSLNDIIYILDIPALPNIPSTLNFNKQVELDVIPMKPMTLLFDTEKKNVKQTDVYHITNAAVASIRHLNRSFCKTCDVIRKVGSCYEILLFLLIGALFVHLIERPYYLILILTSSADVLRVCLLITYCILHTMFLIFVVEPGHGTTKELQRTQILLSQLYRRVVAPGDVLAVELNYFYKQIILNKICYVPMSLFTLTRGFVADVFGGITTYLIIFLQFKSVEQN